MDPIEYLRKHAQAGGQSIISKPLARLSGDTGGSGTTSLFSIAVLSFLLLIIGGPIIYFVWGSVWSTSPGLGGQFTLDGYRQIFAPSTVDTFWNTFIVALVGSVVALGLGLGGVVFTTKVKSRIGWIVGPIFLIQYFLPSYISALAWRFYAGPNGPVNQLLMLLPFVNTPPVDIFSVWGIAIVSGTSYAGIVFLLTKGAIKAVPATLEETAEMSGAPLRKIIHRIDLPLALPSILIAFVIIFTRLLQSFGTPLILGVRGDVYVLATELYLAIHGYPYDFAFASAIGVILLLIAVFGVWVQRRLTGSKEKYETVAGKSDIGGLEYDIQRGNTVLAHGFIALVILLYVFPLLVLIMSSFQQSFLGFKFQYVEWTVENYAVYLTGRSAGRFWTVLQNTLTVSGVGAAFGMLVSVGASYVIVKKQSRISDVLDFLTFVPIVLPGIVIGTAYLWFFLNFNILGLYGTIWLIIIAFTAKFIIYGTRSANSSFRAIGSELEEAAEIAGAGLYTTFKRIYIPLIKSGIVSGYAILFVDYMKSLSIPLLLGGGDSDLIQVLMWRAIANGEAEKAAAVASFIILIITTVYGLLYLLTDVSVTDL